MFARIYMPSRSATQSGQARTQDWVLEYVPERGKFIDPLTGWTGTTDPSDQIQLRFDSREAAVAYAERNGIAYKVHEPTPRRHVLRQNGYGDNFAYDRRIGWTH